ncbi:hypothetical protein BD324DRAFT_616235 [Kockovaella imperatae]|uniref:Alcohol acetyltransferase n=1 Tax=Kockovaella imperatae TaxID=4999 RepID=A0A1Y1URI4_9TREE|nr:hypothetical protein BD324DRAFT_616235 [Kockovaella imperatae]ORX40094.1 hypothetical protein BD324DRAFT_616235 [Kockovaella imperatae]
MGQTKPEYLQPYTSAAPSHYLRHKNGWPHFITFVLSFSSDDAPSMPFLRKRLEDMQVRYPDTRLSLVERPRPESHTLYWSPVSWHQQDDAWPINHILQELDSAPASSLDAYRIAIHLAEQRSLVDCPLFVVHRLVGPRQTFICLSVSHTLTDGIGASNMLRAIIEPELEQFSDESQKGFFNGNLGKPPQVAPLKPYEPFKPDIKGENRDDLAKKDAPIWPASADDFKIHPSSDLPSQFVDVHFSADTIKSLSTKAKSVQIATLNTVFLSTFVMAVIEVMGIKDRRLQSVVPVSFRKKAENPLFFGSFTTALDIITHCTPKTSTWSFIREFSVPANKQVAEAIEARQKPKVDDDRKTKSPVFDAESAMQRDLDRLKSDAAYMDSIVWSNLARLSWLDNVHGCNDVLWGQSTAMFFAPICMSVVGWKGGMRSVCGFKEGSGFTSEQVATIIARWEEIVQEAVDADVKGDVLDVP